MSPTRYQLCYQCFFDDLLFCCKTCAIDIGLLKTTYLLTYSGGIEG